MFLCPVTTATSGTDGRARLAARCVSSVRRGVQAVATYGVKLQRSDDLRLDNHREACTEKNFRTWCKKRLQDGARLAVDLFSGAGGLSLGLERAGWTVALAIDHDEKALNTHRHNFPGLALSRDLSDPQQRSQLIKMLSQTKIDLVAGGPPCQPFSRAGLSKIRSLVVSGHRDAHDERRELWQAFLDVALAIRPRAILMENVPDMALGDDFAVIRTMVHALETSGYSTQVRLVDAWRYGVPQHRKRLILLARLDTNEFNWPAPVDKETTLHDAIFDLPKLNDTIGARVLTYKMPRKISNFARDMRIGARRGIVWDHMTRPVRKDDRETFLFMDSKTLYSSLPDHMRRYSADSFDDKYKKLDWKALSRSITAHIAKDGYWYIHPEEARTLTVREAARIQTFPDRFRFAGTRSDAFRQIGNAVPPYLGYAAAMALRPVHDDTTSVPAATLNQIIQTRFNLTMWAKELQTGSKWYVLPGPDMTIAAAAIASILTSRSPSRPGAAAVMEVVRGQKVITARMLEQMRKVAASAATRSALDRIEPLARRRSPWLDADALAEQLNLKPVERRIFSLLSGNDVLLATQSTLRVAARSAGTESDKVNRMTDGRVDLATLIGAGEDAPLRTAALRILGEEICTPIRSNCNDCPLLQTCRWHVIKERQTTAVSVEISSP